MEELTAEPKPTHLTAEVDDRLRRLSLACEREDSGGRPAGGDHQTIECQSLIHERPQNGCMKKDYEKANWMRLSRIHGDHEYGHEDRLPRIVEEVRHRIAICKKEIFNIGELLAEAKKIVGHGNFKQWIADNFDFSYETANNFMNVYNACLGRPNIACTIKASILYQLSAPNFPEDLREHLFEHGELLENVRQDELKELMVRYKAGELDLESGELKQKAEEQRRNDQLSHLYDSLTYAIRDLEKHKDKISRVEGGFRIGYEYHEGVGRDREAGEKIQEALELMEMALDSFKGLRESLFQ